MQRLKLGLLQILVAVVCVVVWHLATTIPVNGKPLFPPFFFFDTA